MSVTRLSAKRSAEALAPISSHLRSRSPPPTSPIIEKRGASTRTPSIRKEASVASERKRSHIYEDDYETSETVRKRPNTSIPSSAKKRSAAKPRPKQSSAVKEAKATPTRTRKSVPKLPRSAAVGLDEIEADRAYGKDSIDSEDIDEEESPVEKTVHKVVSRAAYENSLKEPSPSKTLGSTQKSAKKEVRDGVDGMDIEQEHPALIDDSIAPHYVTTDSYNIGSEDDSHMDSDYPGDNIPCRDEDGADADVEDEDEEDEDDEEDDAVPAPYDSGVLTEMESDYVKEEVGKVEKLENEDEDGEVEGEGDEGEGDEGEVEDDEAEGEEGEEENRENDDDHDQLSEKEVSGDVVEIDDDAISSDYLSELEVDAEEDDGEDYANTITAHRGPLAADDEVVDLVSSDEEVLEDEEEEEEDDAVEADEDSECDSFLTADSNDPSKLLPIAAADATDSFALVPVVLKKEVTKEDTVADAVNTVLSAFKNSLSAKDFEQLQLIMGKEVKTCEKSEIVVAHEQESEMLVEEPYERTGSRKRIEAVSRLSGDGTSWASRESFQPTSPYDRFSLTMSSILSLRSASNGVSGEKVDSSADNTLLHRNRWNNTVRFEDKANEFRERSSLSSGSSSHIKYGPVTFMRRPMTPFARKMAASPSPLGPSYSNHPDSMSSSRTVGQFSGFKSRPQYMDADVPFPSSDGILRKRGHDESMSYFDSIDDRDQGGSKRLNLGQSTYSVRSAEQSRRSLTAPDSRFSYQDSRFIQNGGQEGQNFAHESVAQGPRVSSSVYTPIYTDNKSRGTFTGVLLQPSQQQSQSQSQARRASFSFSQRRKLTRKSEGSIFNNSTSLAAPISSTSSAYASASVAKKILDTLSELQTPIEVARHRSIAINSAIHASTEAIARSERLAAEPAPKSTGNATLKADPSPGSFSWAFPSVPSVGLAAVAAATATATTTATATATTPTSSTLSFSFPATKSAPIVSETARSTNKIPAITTTAPAHLTPSFSQPSSILKTPRTPNNVRFAAQDSEFTFGDPSEIEGVDLSEIERVLSTPGSKRNEKIRFAFSPPGKAMMSSEKAMRKATPHEEMTKETPKSSSTTPVVTPATSSGESLWTKAASAAHDYQKCPVCFVQNSNTATKCLSCESSLKGAGQAAAAVVAPKSAPAAGESLWTKAASAAHDYQKCPVCFVQNSNTVTKCLSCESSLKGAGQAVTAAAAAPVQSAPATIPAFTFGTAPIASKTATVSAAVPIPTSTPWSTAAPLGPTKDFSGSFSMQPSSAQTAVSTMTPQPGGFNFGAPAPAAATGGAPGFSITPSASTGFTFGGASTAPAVPVAPAPAAPSLVMPPASAAFGGFFTGPTAVPPLASNPFSASSSTVSAPSSSTAAVATSLPATLPASTTRKETVGFQLGAPTSATPLATPAPTAAPASVATFKGFSSITSPVTVTGASEKPQISFGELTATRLNTSLPPTTAPAPFSFGSLPSTTPTTTTIAPFSFGKSETVSAPTSSTPAPAPFMFGSVPAVKPVETAPSFTASPSPFQFGSMNPTPVPAFSATPAFSFDSSSAPAPFRFGASASAVTSTAALASPFPSIVSAQGTSTAFGVDSPNSTMDTGYMSGDASNIGFPPALSSTSFSSAPAPFSFGAPAMSSGTMGSQLPPFGTSSQPFGGGSAPFASSNSSQPFTFGALPQSQPQPQSQSQGFGYAPGIAGASGMFSQPLAAAPSPAFSFDTSRGGGMAPQGMQSMGPSGGGGGFSMGASDNGNRKKVRAKRPGGQ